MSAGLAKDAPRPATCTRQLDNAESNAPLEVPIQVAAMRATHCHHRDLRTQFVAGRRGIRREKALLTWQMPQRCLESSPSIHFWSGSFSKSTVNRLSGTFALKRVEMSTMPTSPSSLSVSGEPRPSNLRRYGSPHSVINLVISTASSVKSLLCPKKEEVAVAKAVLDRSIRLRSAGIQGQAGPSWA